MVSTLRTSFATLFIASFALLSCSKDKNEPQTTVTRANLVNKNWNLSRAEVTYDSKVYSFTNRSYGIQDRLGLQFKENGDASFINAGYAQKGTWSLEGQTVKIKFPSNYFMDFNVTDIATKDSTMTIALAKNISPSDTVAMKLETNHLAYSVAFALMAQNQSIQINKSNKPVDVTLTMKYK